jgi:invasion protein IalB
MRDWIGSTSSRRFSCRIERVAAWTRVLTSAAIVVLALTIGTHALAQQSATKAPAAAAQAAPSETVQNGQQQVQVMSSPWRRYCANGVAEQSSEIRGKEVCFIASDGHLASGQKLVIALLIEPKGNGTKLLRVTLPLGVALVPGARVVIDEEETMTAPYIVCLSQNGCMADFKANADLIDKLKRGHTLAIQAFDKGKPIGFTLPLTGFAKAYGGPPSDPTGLNELREGLPSELQSHSEDHLVTPDGK